MNMENQSPRPTEGAYLYYPNSDIQKEGNMNLCNPANWVSFSSAFAHVADAVAETEEAGTLIRPSDIYTKMSANVTR